MTDAPVQVIRTQLVWVDGEPKIRTVPELFNKNSTERSLLELAKACLNLPYDGKDPRLQGLTKGEAMIVTLVDDASNGSQKAREELMDRIMGKPQQNVKSLKVTADLGDYLDSLQDPPIPAAQDNVIDVSRETLASEAYEV